MAKILYEPSSVRGDFGVLYITEGEPLCLPFIFELPYEDSGETSSAEYIIQPEEVIEFIIKADIKNNTPIIRKLYNQTKNNIAVLRLNLSDSALLKGGREYIMSVRLLTPTGKIRKVLIKQLPIKVQEVA